MVFAAFVIVLLIATLAACLVKTVADLLTFIVNILLGISVLMWFLVNFIWQIIYNCWWYIASSANELVTVVWLYGHLPFMAIIQILGAFSLLSLNFTDLVLRILYYIFLLWVFIYLLLLLYRFITH